MNNFTFLAVHWLWLLLLIPLWLMISVYQQKQSLLDLKEYRKTKLEQQKQFVQQILMLLTITALVLALARPGWDPQPQGGKTHGRDMVFLLDVSRSMLVDDARPNRLEVARQAIQNSISNNSIDRFGLVVFAGSTSIVAPLTNDKTFFNYALEQVHNDSVAQGGTRIEDALFKVLDKLAETDQENTMDIILISDGEDLGGQPERALTKLNELGARLIVIGLGDSEFGGRVPDHQGNSWQSYHGKEVWSKMDTLRLRNLAQEAEQGMFIPVGTATFDLAKIIEKLRQVWPSSTHKKGQVLSYHQGYPYCLFIALLAQIICWLRGRNAWLTGLVLFSFNSQALDQQAPNNQTSNTTEISINNTQNKDETAVTELQVSVSADALSQLTTTAQFSLAESILQDSPEQAADIYRYIASQTQQSSTAILANYNLATSLIMLAEQISQSHTMTDDVEQQFNDDFEMFDDDDDYIDPEIYFDEAGDILRTLLLHAPNHKASQKNLEWLMVRAHAQQNTNLQSPEAQSADKSQQSKQEQTSEDGQQPAEHENKQANEQQSSESQQAQQTDASAMQMTDTQLPTPQDSATDILQQSQERNLRERAPKSKKQIAVERNW
ncbi:VWA domain-containing protein [Thalassotalea fonticola]|uniref:VWA domain-containing protein n=1 Tax=Thalassotalea fonticola TaxID=3065649 RepID=A0ABZ0GV82_9GAMM|nr:VWA domain-containing protein [Colwelliaceae bacterium S1-1]